VVNEVVPMQRQWSDFLGIPRWRPPNMDTYFFEREVSVTIIIEVSTSVYVYNV
jgi:hypothetical protein